ncbi:hypothetical protein CLV35_1945 [Motilibacter peucedani]|uniref:Uncharacterized protein n=1 Tax=Motilibacter peucedani TaxID=598650 RepID=A0A420XQB3_9ACTN|nr:hypothetical protein [Motilibacter peucedani]RKS75478.1 hypothetical protein CLV35_1945 [Motilibacter peucedani]
MKSTRASGLVLAGAVGLAGLGVGAVLGPTAASAATSSTSALTGRASAIADALKGLVSDGTLSQTQADEVASTLSSALPDHGPGGLGGPGGGHGRGADLDTAASVIGISADDLRTALDSGKTLAQVAQGKGVSQSTLVAKLVASEKARLAAAVEAGTLTQAQADSMSADLTARITQEVTTTCAGGGGRGGHGGSRPGTAPSAPTTPATPATPSTPTPTASGSTT